MVLVVLELLLLMVGRGVGGVGVNGGGCVNGNKDRGREEIHCFVYA